MARLTKNQREELDEYIKYYITERRIEGVWWEHAQAIKTALAELDGHRRAARKNKVKRG